MSIEIKRIDGTVAYESQSATTLKEAAEEAVRQGVSLARANFSRADFSLANFSGADFSGADFSGANCSRANFSRANCSEANFSGANFSLANFSGADFSRADFSLADFSRANFSRANFSGADFYKANFYGANFYGADFSRANFYGANFYLAEGILHVGPVDGWDMYAVRWDDGPRIKAGCRWFTVSEARKWWGKGGAPGNKPEHGPLMLAGLEALLALAKDHGWEMPPGQEVAS